MHAPVLLLKGDFREVTEVGHTVVNDRSGRSSHEVDVVATGPPEGDGRAALRLLGEAKVGQQLGHAAFGKLARVRELLADRCEDALAGRVYAGAVLRTGSRVKLADALRSM